MSTCYLVHFTWCTTSEKIAAKLLFVYMVYQVQLNGGASVHARWKSSIDHRSSLSRVEVSFTCNNKRLASLIFREKQQVMSPDTTALSGEVTSPRFVKNNMP